MYSTYLERFKTKKANFEKMSLSKLPPPYAMMLPLRKLIITANITIDPLAK
jgi:hypothetical protein